MYSISSNPEEQKIDLQLLQYNKSFSKKPIVQLEVVAGLKTLFSLSDNVISVNDLVRHNFPLIYLASKTKGATVFALDSKTPKSLTGDVTCVVRMCAAIKRRLQLWYWKYDHFVESDYGIDLTDVPKTLSFSGDNILIGYKTDYVLYDIRASAPLKRDLFPISSSRNMDPCVSILSENVFGVAKDEFLISIYVPLDQELPPTEGQYKPEPSEAMSSASDKKFGTLQWSEPLLALVYDEPYLIGIFNDCLEVRVFNSAGEDSLVQKIPELSRVRFLVRGLNGILYAASASQLWCIEMIDITVQRNQLLQQKKFQLALQLTNISNETTYDKETKINEIQTLYAFDLFHKKEFKSSMREFFKLGTDPTEVIGLFPELLSAGIDNKRQV